MRRRSALMAGWVAVAAGAARGQGASAAVANASAGGQPALPVRVAVEADYGPFVFAGPDGRAQGLSVELLETLAGPAGLVLQWQPARPLNDWLRGIREGQEGRADVVTSVRPTPERAAYLAFSRPYVSVPALVALRTDDPLRRLGVAELLAALDGQPVAVGAGYAVQGFVAARWPRVAWQPVPDDAVALRGVAAGRYAAAVLDAASLSFLRRRPDMAPVTTAVAAGPAVGFDYVLSFGVRRDRPDVLARLDQALLLQTSAERAAVIERWMQPLSADIDRAATPEWPLQTTLLGLMGLGAAVGLWGVWRHRRAGAAGVTSAPPPASTPPWSASTPPAPSAHEHTAARNPERGP